MKPKLILRDLFWEVLAWPLFMLREGPIVDRLIGFLLAALVLVGLLSPLLVRHRIAWFISAISLAAWLLIGWWFSYSAAV